MSESHVLSSPVTYPAPTSLTDYQVVMFTIDRQNPARPWILMAARSNTGVIVEARYEGSVAATLISQLNTANLSTKSLQKRILEKMAADGFLAVGSVTGAPD